MLFVIKVPALKAGRIVGLTISSLLTVAYIGVTLHELRSYFGNQPPKHVKTCSSEDLPMHAASPRTITFASTSSSLKCNQHPRPLPSALVIPTSPSVSMSEHHSPETAAQFSSSAVPPKSGRSPHKRRPKRRRWSSDLDPMLIGISFPSRRFYSFIHLGCTSSRNHNLPSHGIHLLHRILGAPPPLQQSCGQLGQADDVWSGTPPLPSARISTNSYPLMYIDPSASGVYPLCPIGGRCARRARAETALQAKEEGDGRAPGEAQADGGPCSRGGVGDQVSSCINTTSCVNISVQCAF